MTHESPGVWVKSIVGLMTKEPIVVLSIGDASIQLSPSEARGVALNLLECSESAICDLFLVEFAMKTGMEMNAAGVLLHAFREWRQSRESPTESDGANKPYTE